MMHSWQWFIEDQVVYLHLEGDLLWDDYAEIQHKALHALHEATRPLHLIVDLRMMSGKPARLFRQLRRLLDIAHPTLGWIVVLTRMDAASFRQQLAYPDPNLRIRRVAALADALRFLDKADPELSWVQLQSSVVKGSTP